MPGKLDGVHLLNGIMSDKDGGVMATHERIVADPNILVGKPIVRGTRLSVDFLLDLMAQGWPEAEILRNYPGLTHEDLAACLEYANELVRSERVYNFVNQAAP